MAVQDVVVVSIPVSDQDRAKDFYVNKLGFELLREDESVPGMRWIQVAPKGAGTALTLVTWFDTMPAGSLQGLVILSNDIHRDYQEMSARGVQFDGPPEVPALGYRDRPRRSRREPDRHAAGLSCANPCPGPTPRTDEDRF